MLRRVAVANEISAKHPDLKMTMLVRMVDDGGWEVADVSLSDTDKAEIDARLKYAIGDISKKGK